MSTKVPPLNLGGKLPGSNATENNSTGKISATHVASDEKNNKSLAPQPRQLPQSPRSIKTAPQPMPKSPRSLKSAFQEKSSSARMLKKDSQQSTESSVTLKLLADTGKSEKTKEDNPASQTLKLTTEVSNLTTTTTTTTTTATLSSPAPNTTTREISCEPVLTIIRKKVDIPSDLLKKSERKDVPSDLSKKSERKDVPSDLSKKSERKDMPSDLAKKSAPDYDPNMLGDMIIEDIFKGKLLPDQLHQIGRIPTAFPWEKLPSEMQSLAQNFFGPFVSSSKLLQAQFAEDFTKNSGWHRAKFKCVLLMDYLVRQRSSIEIGKNDPQLKEEVKNQMKGHAETVSWAIFGSPATLNNSPLPDRLIKFLIHCDQYFHMKLMGSEKTRHFTTEQMNDARMALQKQLLVTYILQPMLCNLASKFPTQAEIWFLGQTMESMLKELPPLSKEILGVSYANSPKDFQDEVAQKNKTEQQKKIREKRTTEFKKKPGTHQRSRSADVKLVDMASLPTREEMQQSRLKKRTESIAKEFEKNSKKFDKVLENTGIELKENDCINKAMDDLQNFDADDLEIVLAMLKDRDIDSLDDSVGTITTTDTTSPAVDLPHATDQISQTDNVTSTLTTTTTTVTSVVTGTSTGMPSNNNNVLDTGKQDI